MTIINLIMLILRSGRGCLIGMLLVSIGTFFILMNKAKEEKIICRG